MSKETYWKSLHSNNLFDRDIIKQPFDYKIFRLDLIKIFCLIINHFISNNDEKSICFIPGIRTGALF